MAIAYSQGLKISTFKTFFYNSLVLLPHLIRSTVLPHLVASLNIKHTYKNRVKVNQRHPSMSRCPFVRRHRCFPLPANPFHTYRSYRFVFFLRPVRPVLRLPSLLCVASSAFEPSLMRLLIPMTSTFSSLLPTRPEGDHFAGQ